MYSNSCVGSVWNSLCIFQVLSLEYSEISLYNFLFMVVYCMNILVFVFGNFCNLYSRPWYFLGLLAICCSFCRMLVNYYTV
jgi:hypothetical protein